MNVLHAKTDPDLLTRLREMLGSSARADIAVGYFFMSGFDAVADDLARLNKVRILGLIHQTDDEEDAATVKWIKEGRTGEYVSKEVVMETLRSPHGRD